MDKVRTRDLQGIDLDAVREATETLRDAGFDVRGVDDVERTRHGVEFRINAQANTRAGNLKDHAADDADDARPPQKRAGSYNGNGGGDDGA